MKQIQHVSTLIPMVGSTNVLCRIICNRHLATEHQARLDRRISELLEAGLYAAGQQAIGSALSIKLRGSTKIEEKSRSLSVVNLGDLAGMSPENARSAELGLALSWLCGLAGHTNKTIAATGALDPLSSTDVLVCPIQYLGQKLNLLIIHFSKPTATEPPPLCFIPKTDPDGQLTAEKYRVEISLLHDLGVKVNSIRTLKEACDTLEIFKVENSKTINLIRSSIVLSILFICLTITLNQWIQKPIPLTFESIAMPNGRIIATPARVEFKNGGLRIASTLCSENNTSYYNHYLTGDRIAVKISPVSDLLPVYGLGVSVSEQSGAKVFRLPTERLDKKNGSAFLIDIKGSDQQNIFMILSQRLVPFEANIIQEELQMVITNIPTRERINFAQNWLASKGDGYLIHSFSISDKENCK